MQKTDLIRAFAQKYNTTETNCEVFFAPGRINLIGEHTDYNGGFVFPAAITYGTYGAIAKRNDRTVRLYSANFDHIGIKSFDLNDLSKKDDDNWTAYVKGVVWAFEQAGYTLTNGFDAYIVGNIPNGAGLSSSASLELLTSEILQYTNDLTLDMIEKVKLSQKAENGYVGVMCGIMDQFAIGMGKLGHAIKLNTNNLDYDYAPADLGNYHILIMNTNKQRGLADSKYNERRGECEAALAILQKQQPLTYLCDLSPEQFEGMSAELKQNDVLYRRAKHAITESARVLDAIAALKSGDIVKFGILLNASHTSLRDDYEVTGIELDTIVSLAQKQEGVLGARMTGAGFGGCAIALVHKDKLAGVEAAITDGYTKAIGYAPSFYDSQIGSGAGRL